MNKTERKPEHKVHDLILHRWSPRAMSGEKVSDLELMSLFEAAKWAPSAYNSQPWRFLYAKKGTESWNVFYGLLVDFNKLWTAKADVLIVLVVRTTFEQNDKHSVTAEFDTGAAWQNLALQGHAQGLVVHCMSGFDYDRAAVELGIPEDHKVLAMVAVGKPGEKNDLPEELAEKEIVSDRKKITEFVSEGKWSS